VEEGMVYWKSIDFSASVHFGYIPYHPWDWYIYLHLIYFHSKSAGLAGVSSGMGLDDGLLVCTLLLLI